ncbi:UDP-glucose/GDP-mannose dehydrogenase family protein [Candidatus Falkowbacteria bacterium]|nr:UDP-glucose/GDP-mannose dehydrogenase family protein [Candidatus Falkowbacteria bacterium]
MKKNIVVVGSGYVGTVVGACLAKLGHQVTGVDIDKKKIAKLKRGFSPIYEPGLEELIRANLYKGRLHFTTSLPDALSAAEVVFIAVGTPARADGSCDMKYVWEVAHEIGRNLDHYAVIANKSTVPVGTAGRVRKIIASYKKTNFDVVSNPEFQREGSSVKDFLGPDRIVVGADSPASRKIMREVYSKIKTPKLFIDTASAEMVKYAANAFLATKISYINEIANICEQVGADVKTVAEGVGMDRRIGYSFLDAGLGYGGSCFPKDVKALHNIALNDGYDFKLLKGVIRVNQQQRELVVKKIKRLLGKKIKGKKVAVFGLAFKNNTDDVRESASVEVIKMLKKSKLSINAYDPMAIENAKKVLGRKVRYFTSPYKTVENASLVLIATEWPEFRGLNWKRIKKLMKTGKVVDGRNLLERAEMERLGFEYEGVGR